MVSPSAPTTLMISWHCAWKRAGCVKHDGVRRQRRLASSRRGGLRFRRAAAGVDVQLAVGDGRDMPLRVPIKRRIGRDKKRTITT